MFNYLKRLFSIIAVIAISPIVVGCAQNDHVNLCDIDLSWQQPDSIINPDSQYLVVIGDIQEYTPNDKMAQYLYKTCDWLRAMQHYNGNIAAVLQNGDLTWNNSRNPWIRADHSLVHLGSDLIFIPSTGNHDYKWEGKDKMEILNRETTLLNEMPNIARLRNEDIEYFEQGKLENIIVPIKGLKGSWDVIALEFGPRKEAVAWADSIVRANPEKKYILMTHEWLTRDGIRIDQGSSASQQFGSRSYSTPQEIWEKMVYPNNNIICVLCGHNGFCNYLFSQNEKGREVCQILFNLQYQKNGGDGLVQLWRFSPDEEVIDIFLYNTITRKIYSDPDTMVKIPLR